MQTAGVDVYVNHPVLHLGATSWVPYSLQLGDAAAASCDTHVAVRVRAQSGLIRVRLFQEDLGDTDDADPTFTTVFDGQLLFDDGLLAVGDVEGHTRFVHRVGDRGAYGVRISVDVSGRDARAVDVTLRRPAE